MTIANKTPMARKAARSYCRRCLAVMLCCVLVLGLTVRVTPKASANAAVETVEIVGAGGGAAGAAALGSNPVGATICGLLLTVVGVDFAVGYFEHDQTKYYSDGVYKLGGKCWDSLYSLGGDIAEWCMSRSSSDVLPGSTFEAPHEVLEAVRQWAVTNIDFTDGSVTYTQSGIYTDSGFLAFSQFPLGAVYNEFYYYADYGSIIACPSAGQIISYSFGDKVGNIFRYDFFLNSQNQFQVDFYRNGALLKSISYGSTNSFTFAFAPYPATSGPFLALLSSGRNLTTGAYHEVLYNAGNKDASSMFMHKADMPLDGTYSVGTVATDTSALTQERTEGVAVTVPASVPTTTVGDLTIPVFGDLTAGDLTGEKEDENNKPGAVTAPWDRVLDGIQGVANKVGAIPGAVSDALTGTMAGVISKADAQQQAVENSLAEPDDLGAVFISKFPFCIPWDVAKAVGLLAAPPVTPRWEMDFMEPIGQRIGGFQGDTTVVIDFGEYPILGIATRWFSTLMFVYALASGTKKLIWTA